MHSYANRQTDSRIGVRRCSTSPDIITGFEARRRLLSRYEYSRNERNDRERQENIRDYQRARGTGRPRDPNRIRRPRCNPPLFDISRPRRRPERGHQARPSQRGQLRNRHVSDSSESDRRSSRGSSTSDATASHRERERNETNTRKRSSGQESSPLDQTASDSNDAAPRKTLIAKRSLKVEAYDTSDTDNNEPSSSKSKSPDRIDSKGRDLFMDSPPHLTSVRADPATPEESADSSNDDSSSDQKLSKKRGKKTKKERKKSKKAKKKLHKAHKVVKKEKKKSKKTKVEVSTSTGHSSGGERSSGSSSSEAKVENGFLEGESQNVGSSQDVQKMRKKMAPMTKEQWEKQQSQIRREVSPTTGRVRVIKGTGEILEEIVSRDRHKAINRMATIGDGQAFQASLQKKLKKN